MRIKTTTLAAGPNGVTPADTEMEVTEDIGLSMIAAGHAVRVSTAEPTEPGNADDSEGADVETAALGGEETAATRTGRGFAKKRGR